MDIEESILHTGLTEKAIEYYAGKGLIEVENGNISDQDIERLKKILILSTLDIKVDEMSQFLMNDKKFAQLLKKYFNSLDVNEIEKQLDVREKQKPGYMNMKLKILFPGFFGRYVSSILSDYIDVSIDTLDKENSLKNIIKILDKIEYPDSMINMENTMKKNSINWEVVEKFIKNSRESIGVVKNVSIYDYPDILNNFELTEEDINFCNDIFSYMNSQKQIDYINNLFSLLNSDLKVLSDKYKNSIELRHEDVNNIHIGKGIINMQEMVFAACEYRKFFPFGNVDNLVNKFKPRIGKIKNVIDPDSIYVIKGITSIPKYRESKMSIFKFGFSFIIGVRISDASEISEDMKTFVIPPHKYVWYTSNGDSNLKDFIKTDISNINSLNEKYKLSNFPMIQLYNEKVLGNSNSGFVFNNYIPIE